LFRESAGHEEQILVRKDTWGTASAVGIGVGIGIGLSVPFMCGNEKERRILKRSLTRTARRFAWPLATMALRHGPVLATVMSALRPLLARR
jgi:hypothetical protein